MPKVITVGEILVEVMASTVGQSFLQPGNLIGPYPSGAPAIFIDQVARMNVDSGIISRIGKDDFGELNRIRLNRDGVDTSQVLETEGYTTGTAFVTYNSDSSRKFIFHFTHSAAGRLAPDDIDESYLSTAEYLHIMGCSLSASESMRGAIRKALRFARNHGVKVSFDPNLRPELMGTNEVRLLFQELLLTSDIVFVGRNEFFTLIGGQEHTAEMLKTMRAQAVILRDGKNQITVYERGSVWSMNPPQAREVDPTGAGDCFDGAAIAALVKGYDLKTAVAYGATAGALSVEKKGPMEGVSSQVEIELALKRYGDQGVAYQ